jgi:hypothetical protein
MYLVGKDNNISRPNSRARRTKNDIVYTNPAFAKAIIDYFKPTGFCLDPCRGDGAFYNHLPEPKDWCEIEEGRDFLYYVPNQKIDYIITNFPWSAKAFRPLVRKACKISDNVIHLVRLHNVFGTIARHKDFRDEDHRLKELIIVPWRDTFINKSQEGFCLCVIHTQKNYNGDCKWSYWV